MGAITVALVPGRGGGDLGLFRDRREGAVDEGEAAMKGDSTKGLYLEFSDGSDAGMEKAQHNVDPGRLGGNGGEGVGGGVYDIVEEATSSLHLHAGRSGIIVANAINCLGDEGVKGLVVGHEFTGLAFARFDRGTNDRVGVEDGSGLKGSDRRCELRDGKGLAGEESLT